MLAARSGLWSREQTLGAFAQIAASCAAHPGSRWRPLIDTTRDPIIAARNPLPWQSWQRSEDYYSEGALIWLDVDSRIRELTDDQRSLDDFARAFFGADDGVPVTHSYMFADVVATLEQIVAHDWRTLLEELVTNTHEGAPMDGLTRSGYRLVYRDEPNAYTRGVEALSGVADLSFSIGLKVGKDGQVSDVQWEGPAFEQAIITGAAIVAVNGRMFDLDLLKEAIDATSQGGPLRLTIRSGKHIRDVTLNYSRGLRFPALERTEGAPARLDDILRPL